MKKSLAALAALTLITAGCGDSGSETSSDTITVMAPLFGTAPDPNGELQQAVQKLIGKKLQITWVPNADYSEKTNVTLASNNMPQAMVIQGDKQSAFVQAAQAGAFWDLTGKLDKYPNLTPADPTTGKNATVNGKTYGIYRVRPLLRSAISIRKDWLEKLGLQMPKTVDDLQAIAKAFTERDPDGNGKKDTYGLIVPKWPGTYASSSPYDVIETWFGAPNGWGERGGKLVPGFDTEEFVTANKWLKNWVDNGWINPDFATLDSANWNKPFVQGRGGIILDVNVRSGDLVKLFKETDPKNFDKVALAGNLARTDGQKFSAPFPGYNGIVAIPKQKVKTEEQLDQVLQVLDKLQAKEGTVLLTNGIEGRNFKLEDGYAAPLDEDNPQIKVINNDVEKAFIQLGTRASVGLGAYPPKPADEPSRKLVVQRNELATEDLKTAVHNPALGVVSETYIKQGKTLDLIIPDARIKFLSGDITEEQLRAEIKRWYAEGGDKVAQETNDLVAKLGK
ncbi:putative aldouronate transport system substrate-binding protein [Actinoplanes tereljensis]|uniref:Lipoprotein LipO n=1 Tax=Paractinoplanes tereljensis TaxID=571912 RepID=A0A919NFZ6_9ACTN|nr:extracellular solute-binding protein [Actinoplanes tereljensis]GIF17488.1 lipoprotein LipO [Actinoplanes tereljensis]